MSSDDDDELFGPSSSIQGGAAAADEELTLPRAAMNKMIKEVISKMKVCITTGPSGIVADMVQTACDAITVFIRDLIIAMIRECLCKR